MLSQITAPPRAQCHKKGRGVCCRSKRENRKGRDNTVIAAFPDLTKTYTAARSEPEPKRYGAPTTNVLPLIAANYQARRAERRFQQVRKLATTSAVAATPTLCRRTNFPARFRFRKRCVRFPSACKFPVYGRALRSAAHKAQHPANKCPSPP